MSLLLVYRLVYDTASYQVGFVHPASGRTAFHLASAVSIELFEVELAAFAQQVGAGPHKQIVLVLDQAGWHASVRLRAPTTCTSCSCHPILPSSSQPSTSGHSPTPS